MNYITEINSFYNWQIENPISANTQALWHRLMAYCNAFGWKVEFSLTNSRLVEELGISRQELDRVRNVLCQKGLISYKKGAGNQCGFYTIYSFVSQENLNPVTQVDTQSLHKCGTMHDTSVAQVDTQSLPLNKLNKTKQNKTIYKKEKVEKEKSVCVFFEKLWSAYPRKQGKQSVTQKSMSDINAIGLDKMLSAINAYKRYIADNEIEERYIKMGSTFFNGGYMDYLDDEKEKEEEEEVLTDPNCKTWEDIKHMTDQEVLDLI